MDATHSLVLTASAVNHDTGLVIPGYQPLRRRPIRNALVNALGQLRQLSQRLRAARRPVLVDAPEEARFQNAHAKAPARSHQQRYAEEPQPRRRLQWRRVARVQARRAEPPAQALLLPERVPETQQQPAVEDEESCGGQVATVQPRTVHVHPHHHHQHQQPLHVHTPAALQRRGPLRALGRLLRHMGAQLRPQGPGGNDTTPGERVLNVGTCGTFFFAGARILRLCRSLAARRFGVAFMGVGVVATLYHASWGRLRPLARKVDYYSIALASLLLRSALLGPMPRVLSALMLAAVPFRPFLVSSCSFAAVEAKYLALAATHRSLLASWAAHAGMSAGATAMFTLEDTVLLRWFPYTHAAFHVLSAGAFVTLPSAFKALGA